MIRWDLWEFRNGILHAPNGPLAIARHSYLNSLIGEDFRQGTDGIHNNYYYLFSGDNTLEKLRSSDIISKEQWLESVLMARREYEPPEAPIAKESQLRRHMHEYLVSLGLRTNTRSYNIPSPVEAPETDDPTISEEYLQGAMKTWLSSTPHNRDNQTIDNPPRNNPEIIDITENDSETETHNNHHDLHNELAILHSEHQATYFPEFSESQTRHFHHLPASRRIPILPQPIRPLRQHAPPLRQSFMSDWSLRIR